MHPVGLPAVNVVTIEEGARTIGRSPPMPRSEPIGLVGIARSASGYRPFGRGQPARLRMQRERVAHRLEPEGVTLAARPHRHRCHNGWPASGWTFPPRRDRPQPTPSAHDRQGDCNDPKRP